MKHLKLFEDHNKKEDIEDCFLEITDSYPGFYAEEYKKTGNTIQLVVDIIGESLSCITKGTYRGGKMEYEIEKYIRNNWTVIEDDTSEGLYPTRKGMRNDKSYQIMSGFIKSMPSVLSKLCRFVIGDRKIRFTINMYQVERGTCIVFYLEY
jgi:hypothetical protein